MNIASTHDLRGTVGLVACGPAADEETLNWIRARHHDRRSRMARVRVHRRRPSRVDAAQLFIRLFRVGLRKLRRLKSLEC
jgi:hypothetical protein